MTKLSGVVAILDDQGAVIGYRDLGPVPIEVKPGRVLPVEDVKATLAEGQVLGAPVVVKRSDKVVRTYAAITPEPAPPSLEDRLAAVEARLAKIEGGR